MRLRRRDAARMLLATVTALVLAPLAWKALAPAAEQTPWEPASMPPGWFRFIAEAGRSRFANESTASARILRSSEDGSLWTEVDLPPPIGGGRRSLTIDQKVGDLRFV